MIFTNSGLNIGARWALGPELPKPRLEVATRGGFTRRGPDSTLVLGNWE